MGFFFLCVQNSERLKWNGTKLCFRPKLRGDPIKYRHSRHIVCIAYMPLSGKIHRRHSLSSFSTEVNPNYPSNGNRWENRLGMPWISKYARLNNNVPENMGSEIVSNLMKLHTSNLLAPVRSSNPLAHFFFYVISAASCVFFFHLAASGTASVISVAASVKQNRTIEALSLGFCFVPKDSSNLLLERVF